MSASEVATKTTTAIAQGSFGGMQARSSAALNNARIAISDLSFFYGDNQALKSIRLDIPARQVTGMIGPSG